MSGDPYADPDVAEASLPPMYDVPPPPPPDQGYGAPQDPSQPPQGQPALPYAIQRPEFLGYDMNGQPVFGYPARRSFGKALLTAAFGVVATIAVQAAMNRPREK